MVRWVLLARLVSGSPSPALTFTLQLLLHLFLHPEPRKHLETHLKPEKIRLKNRFCSSGSWTGRAGHGAGRVLDKAGGLEGIKR
ncbi:hypothetical protein E2C01_061812 [Portunus trituberculatus]|uniref:Secreted protein n=1 Tax=Portunus trituberculatus TaxID=210409 RepID=A0A5B7HDF3_PORTR|nr:hypothetical protein [Portunus trituberculatus]